MSVKCTTGCGKKFISHEHMMRHHRLAHPIMPQGEVKRKGWATPYGFGDWKEPVTYEEACEQMKKMVGEIKWPTNQIEGGEGA